MEKNILGVIGGMGPAATAYFMDLVVRMTRAESDQAHLDMIVFHTPTIPDRTGYILDHEKENPLPAMIDAAQKLTDLGVGHIAIPCITAHYFYEALGRVVSAPILNAVEETAAHLKAKGIQRVGVMATDGTLVTGVFQNELVKQGLEPVYPSAARQKEVMSLIYEDVKSGRPADMERFERVAGELRTNGAQVIVLGCTELSIIKRDCPIGPGFIDTLEVLARKAILCCGGEVREEYQNLVSEYRNKEAIYA